MRRGAGLLLAVLAVIAAAWPLPVRAEVSTPPRIIVTGCIVDDGELVVGRTDSIGFRLRNTSDSAAVYSVLVTGWWADDNPPVEFAQTNQAYIGRIGADEEVDVLFPVETRRRNTGSLTSLTCNLTISYSDGQREMSNTVQTKVPVAQEDAEAELEPEPEEPTPSGVEAPPAQPGGRRWLSTKRMAYLAGFGLCALGAAAVVFRRRHR